MRRVEPCGRRRPNLRQLRRPQLALFNFAGSEFYTTVEGRVANHYDGTKTYTVTVVSADDANAGWDIELSYGRS